MRTAREPARDLLSMVGLKGPWLCAEAQRRQAREIDLTHAWLILREPPRFAESDAEYIARAERELSRVSPTPVVEHCNEAPIRARFSVLPPGLVRWTEQSWEAWGLDVLRRTGAS